MEKVTIERAVKFDDTVEGRFISGFLTLIASDSVRLDGVNGKVFLEARGMMQSKKKLVTTFNVSGHTMLKKSDSTDFSFSVRIPESITYTYHGENVNFAYRLEFSIKVNREDLQRLDRSFFSKMKALSSLDDSVKFAYYPKFKDLSGRYAVKEEVLSMGIGHNIYSNILSVILVVLLLIGLLRFTYNPAILVICGFGTFLLFRHLIWKYLSSLVGEIKLRTRDEEGHLVFDINRDSKINIEDWSIGYRIREVVLDNRGSTSSTHFHTLFESSKIFRDLTDSELVRYKYPSEEGLYTTTFGDASIQWEVLIRSTYLGMKVVYRSEFEVYQFKS